MEGGGCRRDKQQAGRKGVREDWLDRQDANPCDRLSCFGDIVKHLRPSLTPGE